MFLLKISKCVPCFTSTFGSDHPFAIYWAFQFCCGDLVTLTVRDCIFFCGNFHVELLILLIRICCLECRDAIRLMLLYKYGGWYADLESVFLRPLNKVKNVVSASMTLHQARSGQQPNFLLCVLFEKQ